MRKPSEVNEKGRKQMVAFFALDDILAHAWMLVGWECVNSSQYTGGSDISSIVLTLVLRSTDHGNLVKQALLTAHCSVAGVLTGEGG